MTPDFDRSVFWPELKAAGMLRSALVRQSGRSVAVVDVKYVQPTELRLDGSQGSQQHSIKYQHHDLPRLAEGDLVTMLDDDGKEIRSERFRVREAPAIVDSGSPGGSDRSGYFRWALLTRIT